MKSKNYLNGLMLFFALLYAVFSLTSCGSGGGGGNNTGDKSDGMESIGPPGVITGQAMKGPISGGSVTAYAVMSGAKGTVLGTAVTDTNGSYNISTGNYSGPVLLEITGGSYIDEATGKTINLPTTTGSGLQVVVDSVSAGSTLQCQITPLTTMAVVRAQNIPGGLTISNINAANKAIGEYFGGIDILNTQPINPLISGSASSASQSAVNYGLILAGLSQEAKTLGLSDPFDLFTALAQDISDGVLDGKASLTAIFLGGSPMDPVTGTSALASAITTFVQDTTHNMSGGAISETLITLLRDYGDAQTAPEAPTMLEATDTPSDQGGSVSLTWIPSVSGDVTEQRLYRSTTTGGPYSLLATFTNNTANSYTDSGLINGTTYYYIVRAWDGVNESADSNEAIAVPVDNIPLISISKIGTGSGDVTSNPSGIDCGIDCLEEYPTGTEVTLTPVPYPGVSFSGWSGGGDCADGFVTMDTDKSCVAIFSQKTWANTYGGEGADWPSTIQQTSDGGYIVAGSTDSFGGNGDIWVIRLDGNGDVLWQKTYYGGEGWGWLGVFIQQTNDGNYIMAGTTDPFYGNGDVWVMKLNVSGDILWQKTYGGEGWEWASSIQQTFDDGYVVVSSTTDPVNGNDNVWVIKLDENGSVKWQKSYGGEGWEWPSSIQQNTDGGYIVAGSISDTIAGDSDALVIKLDESGVVEWMKRFTGEGSEGPSSIQQTSDGGYIVAGDTSDDAWVMKLDKSGTEIWQKAYSGSGYEWATSIQQLYEGGYIVAGSSSDPSGDAWVMNLDENGSVIWVKSYGGDFLESASAIQQTSEGGYILAGSTASFGAGKDDIWILKLDADGNVTGCVPGVIIPTVSSVVQTDTNVTSTLVIPPAVSADTTVSTETIIAGTDSNAIPVTWCSGVSGEDSPLLP